MSKQSLDKLRNALNKPEHEKIVIDEFVKIWPLIEAILEAFSGVTKLPIFACISDTLIYQSGTETLPPFCTRMLASPDLATLCTGDAGRRASKSEPDINHNIQYCHAGLANGRREIDTGSVGRLTILFGAKQSHTATAVERRTHLLQRIRQRDPDLAMGLQEALTQDPRAPELEESDSILMDAIADIIQRLLEATVSAHAFAINMAHELSLAMIGVGLLCDELEDLEAMSPGSNLPATILASVSSARRNLLTQGRLGLYVVRNFLSHTSETRYQEVVRPQFELVNMCSIFEEMIELYKLLAAKKQIVIDTAGLELLPKIPGSGMELRRLLHNVLSNAVKYSYHSIQTTQRRIRIRTKVPYDPGFRERRFSVVIDNYGLGLTKEEARRAFDPGFRGYQARREVAVGAGIGLSEAAKIMKVHHGKIQIHSEPLYGHGTQRETYHTSVELIFPYSGSQDLTKRGGC
jgi:signal transduction histidine kinase